MTDQPIARELQSGVLTSPADALLGQAIAATLATEPSGRAALFARMVDDIEAFMAARPHERPWTCRRYIATDGAQVFRGGVGHSLVIDTEGRLWRARSYEDFETGYAQVGDVFEIATLTPIYAQMREYR